MKSKLLDAVLAAICVLVTIASATVAQAQNAYIANFAGNSVSVIDTATSMVTATIGGFNLPYGVAATSDGSKVYVTNLLGQRFGHRHGYKQDHSHNPCPQRPLWAWR